jgi:hypothetical protein
LASGGNGRIIFRRPLLERVKNHVKSEWDKNHYLFFSGSKEIAYKVGEYGLSSERYPCYETMKIKIMYFLNFHALT